MISMNYQSILSQNNPSKQLFETQKLSKSFEGIAESADSVYVIGQS